MKKDAKPTDAVVDRYVAFFTNMSVERVILAYEQLPEEYRKRWGIETGFRVQDNVQAKTASPNYAVRVVYVMLSTFLYNIWVYANVILARKLRMELKKPRIKLSQLAHYFRRQIEQPCSLPKPHLRNYCKIEKAHIILHNPARPDEFRDAGVVIRNKGRAEAKMNYFMPNSDLKETTWGDFETLITGSSGEFKPFDLIPAAEFQ